jgi:hypothetical protein
MPQAEFINGAVVSKRELEDAIELGRASRHYEAEWARDLAFEPATELESIELRETSSTTRSTRSEGASGSTCVPSVAMRT